MIALSQGRLQDRRPLSIIDIGSNSIRLVIYEGIARSPTVLFNEKMLAGLGRGIVSTGKLDPEAVTRSMEEFRRFRALSEQAGRRAAPRDRHRRGARGRERAGLHPPRRRDPRHRDPRAVSGREEAHYSALGVISGFHPADGIAGDLGGGSLELVDVNGEAIGDGITLPLGGLRLQDMAKNSLAPRPQDRARARSRGPSLLKGGQGRAFYAVGGTWRNLARLHMNTTNYPLAVMHHYEMGIESSAAFLQQVARGDIDKIKGIEGVSKTRRALLPYGAIVLQEIIAAMKPSKIVVSALGVREGFLYSLLPQEEQRTDPLISAAEELALLRARSVTHARELVDWTAQIAGGLRHRRDRGGGALPPGRLPARRHRLARASGISRHAVAQHHRACLLHRRRPSGPAVPRAGQRLPPRGRLQRRDRAGAEGAGDAALSSSGRGCWRDDARRLSAVGVDARRHAAG